MSDIEATPAHELPGNVRYESEESDNLNSTVKKRNRINKSGDSNESSTTDRDEHQDLILNTEVTNYLTA